MIFLELIPFKRRNSNIGLVGLSSRGKSLFEAYYCHEMFKRGYKIFSNMPLSFEHIFIDDLADIKSIKNRYPNDQKKVALFDDLEFWFSNRNWKNNQSLNDITLFFGKINCNIIYSSKTGNVDINLRNITDRFYIVDLIQYIYPKKLNVNPNDFMNFNCIRLRGFDIMGNDLDTCYLVNIEKYRNLYDTGNILKKLKS